MGYDFHLTPSGPRLIEVNTNAGGAFLNAVLARAQRACCGEAVAFPPDAPVSFEETACQMFQKEWLRQRGSGSPAKIAIVDDRPEQQFLYREFELARRVLTQHGMRAIIADASQLAFSGGRLRYQGQEVDLVYNRLTDFALEQPHHRTLRAAYQDGAVVLTPNPHNHALLADKRDLTILSDASLLQGFDDRKMTEAAITHLTTIGSDCNWIGRHRIRQGGHLGAVAFGKRAHRIAAGKDASQALLVVDYQHRACAALPHAPAGLLHRLVLRQHQELLVFDDIRELSVDHDPSVSAGWFGFLKIASPERYFAYHIAAVWNLRQATDALVDLEAVTVGGEGLVEFPLPLTLIVGEAAPIGSEFLPKPYTSSQLTNAVGHLLEAA